MEEASKRKSLDFMISASDGALTSRFFSAWRDYQLEAQLKRIKEQRSINWLQSCGDGSAHDTCVHHPDCGAACRLRDVRYALPFELAGGCSGERDQSAAAAAGPASSFLSAGRRQHPDDTWRLGSSLLVSGSPTSWLRQSPSGSLGGELLDSSKKMQHSSSDPGLRTSTIPERAMLEPAFAAYSPMSSSRAPSTGLQTPPRSSRLSPLSDSWRQTRQRGPPPPDLPGLSKPTWEETSHWSTGWQCWVGTKTGQLRLWEENSSNVRPYGKPHNVGYTRQATSMFMTGEPLTTLV